MKIFGIDFGRRTVAGVLTNFTNMIDELDAIEAQSSKRAVELEDKSRSLYEESNENYQESVRAAKARDKVKELIGL